MSAKTYTLELTADELDGWADADPSIGDASERKLIALAKHARADREAADLRLPWRAVKTTYPDGHGFSNTWWVEPPASWGWSERGAKLAAATAELLEALKRADAWFSNSALEMNRIAFDGWVSNVKGTIDRAFRKVETGVPE